MTLQPGERGVARGAWLVMALLTAVLAGATFNKCLVCGPAVPPHPAGATQLAQGELLNAPPPAPTIESPLPVEGPPPEPPQPEPEAEEPPPPAGEFTPVTFDKLASYVYVYPEMDPTKPLKDQIPESIKKLANRKIAIQGFMIPVKLEGEEVVEFLLVRNQFACCYGVMPKMNEWIHGKMAPGKTAAFLMDIPITVFGTLGVGEVIEDGVVMSLYRIEADEVTKPPTFR